MEPKDKLITVEELSYIMNGSEIFSNDDASIIQSGTIECPFNDDTNQFSAGQYFPIDVESRPHLACMLATDIDLEGATYIYYGSSTEGKKYINTTFAIDNIDEDKIEKAKEIGKCYITWIAISE